MSQILTTRTTYKPFLYPQAYELWLQQQQAHWLFTEVQMSSDIKDWQFVLTPAEKNVIAGILKGFTQTEVIVNEYWGSKVTKWFPHPEITMMASAFSSFETIHTAGYAYLNDSLGIEDYSAFLSEPSTKAKIDRIVDIPVAASKSEIAKSLAIFSAFTEGVSLYSSFAALFSFSRFNKLKGVGQIISWSNRDEQIHSAAGCWLFRQLIKENPELWTDELKKEIYEAARVTVQLEDDFIDKVFELGPIEGLDPKDLKNFIRQRANAKLGDLGLKANWKNIDKESLKKMEWFDVMTGGSMQTDFFASRETQYQKGGITFDNIFDD